MLGSADWATSIKARRGPTLLLWHSRCVQRAVPRVITVSAMRLAITWYASHNLFLSIPLYSHFPYTCVGASTRLQPMPLVQRLRASVHIRYWSPVAHRLHAIPLHYGVRLQRRGTCATLQQ